MKKILVLSCFALLLCLSSCLKTLHPLFTAKDLITDDRIPGQWKVSGDTITFRRAVAADFDGLPDALRQLSGKAYVAREIADDGRAMDSYLVFLLKLGNNTYFDFYPLHTRALGLDRAYMQLNVALHSLYKVKFIGDRSFTLAQFSDEYLHNLVKTQQLRIRHELIEDDKILVTASTKELQQYVIKYGDVAAAYDNDTASYKKLN